MLATATPVLVRPYASQLDFERRTSERVECDLDATTHSLDSRDTMAWGATVRDVSRTGVGLTICFPFRAGTFLAVDLHGTGSNAAHKNVLTRVAHVRDRNDGTWHVGCEFLKPLSEEDFERLV